MSQLLEPLTYTPVGPIFDKNGVRMDDPSATVYDEDGEIVDNNGVLMDDPRKTVYDEDRLSDFDDMSGEDQEAGQESSPGKEGALTSHSTEAGILSAAARRRSSIGDVPSFGSLQAPSMVHYGAVTS